MIERLCDRCEGSGQIANSDSGEPWPAWENLPPGSDVAVRLGIVKPIPCPDCGGKGTRLVAEDPSNARLQTTNDLLDDLLGKADRQLEYLRGAIAEAVGYTLTGDVDTDDAQLVDRLHALKEDLRVTNALLIEREAVLQVVPHCPLHGACVPHALEWLRDTVKELTERAPQLRAHGFLRLVKLVGR